MSCAQRLTASLNGSPCRSGLLTAAWLCSTPYGVIEWFAAFAADVAEAALSCSTPYGVIEWFARPWLAVQDPDECAQRLTASLNGSQEMARRVAAACLLCSTPYGVIEWFALEASHGPDRLSDVLNALRRH